MKNTAPPALYRRRKVLAGAVTTAVAATAIALTPTGAAFAADTAAPTLDVATRTPVHPIPAYTSIISNTTWAPSTATGIRDWYTNGTVTLRLSATDDTDVTKFTVKVGAAAAFDVAAVQSGTGGTAEYVFTGDQTNNVVYAAVDSAGNTSATRTIAIKLDSTPPVLTWPGVVDGKVSHSTPFATIKPVRSDATPGAGGATIREMWIDGKKVNLVPFDPATLSVGEHTWAATVGDAAGLQAKYTLTFEITTSFADVEALIQRYVTAGTISVSNGATLSSLLADAQTLADADNDAASLTALDAFAASAKALAPKGTERTVLTGDAAALKSIVSGTVSPVISTGITSEAIEAAPRMPQVYAGPAVVNEDPDFKVLLFANRVGGFRHQHIPATMKFIQAAGAEQNFDVDIFDYMAPNESVAGNPFETIENLRQYDAIVGVSSVGNSQFITNRPTFDPNDDVANTVDEQAILKQYINEGGGFVAIHGATDSMHTWPWYRELSGGAFQNHGSSSNGSQHNCEACKYTEVLTEDGTNPATEHFPESYYVLDELYNWIDLPRTNTHVLQTLTESTYTGGLNAADGTVEGPDHPISWCQNFEGGRSFAQGLMHNFELSDDPMFQKNIVEAIRWTAGETEANCVTHNELTKLVAADLTAGDLTSAAAGKFTAAITASFNAYNYPSKDFAKAAEKAEDVVLLAQTSSNGSAAELAVLEAKGTELVEWMTMLADNSTVLRFTAQPESASVTVGSPVVFSATAKGTDVTYQWQKKSGSGSWTDIAGETSFALSVTPTAVSEDGTQYRVQIGDATNDLNSAVATLSVEVADSSLAVPSTATQIAGKTSTLQVDVSGAEGLTATGSVTVKEGSTTVVAAELVDGSVSISLPKLSAGAHALVVSYSGDANHAGSTANVALNVTKGGSSTTSAPTSVSKQFAVKSTVVVSVAGANSVNATGTVTLTEGSATLATGTLANGKVTLAVPAKLSVGSHTLVATYSGDANLVGSTTSIALKVSKATTSTTVKVTGTATVKKKKSKTVTITVAAAGISPAGTVHIYDGSKKIATKTVKNGKATFTFKSSKTGTHKLSAKYNGSDTAKSSTSPKVSIKVTR